MEITLFVLDYIRGGQRPQLRRTRIAASLGLLALAALAGCARPPRVEAISGFAQGTTYTLQWWSPSAVDAAAFSREVTSELERLDALLSNYRSDSVLEQFNASRSTDPQPLPAELVALLRLASDVHGGSSGCFDPTVRPLVHLWGFDGDAPHVPGDDELAAVRSAVGFDQLELVDGDHVRKRMGEVQLDMSSIGQGYTVRRLAAIAERFGLTNYLVEIGGELAGRGRRPDGSPWRVGIERPETRGGVLLALTLPPERTTAVITSGSYRHYFEEHGEAYGHILDPRTGRPTRHALVSVTVTGSDPAVAAAWATALLCLGPDDAPATAESQHIAALLIVRVDSEYATRPTAAFARDWPAPDMPSN